MKKIAATLVCIYMAAHLSACTSKESREDDATAPTEETAAVDSELEKVEGADAAAATAGSPDEANAGFVDEQLPEQALGEQPAAAPAVAANDGLDATSPPPDLALDSGAPAATTPAVDQPLETPVAQATPQETATNEAPVAGVDLGTGAGEKHLSSKDTASSAPADAAPKPSLKKVQDTPFHEGGQLLNAVYVARKGDNYSKIAKNIYGDKKKASDLKAANPTISSVNVGDKIYYNSPVRPTDDAMMKNFYEDTGAQPEVYVAKEGDDLKKVAKNILGNKNAWKELWVTNKDLESKGKLTAGTEIHYWKGSTTVASSMGDQSKPEKHSETASAGLGGANQPPEQFPPAGEQLPPPPPPGNNMAMNNPPPPAEQLPPPPSDMGPPTGINPPIGAAGTTVTEAPPPPPPAEMAPPPPPPMEQAPPPPPVQKGPKHEVAAEQGFSNDDMMMGLAAAGILAAGIAAIMVIRKRRQQKEMAAAFGDTQIGAS